MSITNNFPMAFSSNNLSYFFTSDGTVTLEAGAYYICMIGGGGGGCTARRYGGSYGYSANYVPSPGASAASIHGLICSDTAFDISFIIGKGGVGNTGTDSASGDMEVYGTKGGNTTLSLLGVTLSAKGGGAGGYKRSGSSSGPERAVKGKYTIDSCFSFLLVGEEGVDYVGATSTPDNVYTGGISYNNRLYGAGGQGVNSFDTNTLRDGTNGCLLIIKT